MDFLSWVVSSAQAWFQVQTDKDANKAWKRVGLNNCCKSPHVDPLLSFCLTNQMDQQAASSTKEDQWYSPPSATALS